MVSKLLFLFHQVVLGLRDSLRSGPPPHSHSGKFVRGINFGGPALTIEGDRWLSFRAALANGLTMAGAQTGRSYVRPRPGVTYGLSRMLNTVAFKEKGITLQQSLANGPYDIYLWVMENHQSYWHSLQVGVDDQVIAPAIGELKLGDWARYGPYRVVVHQGHLNLTLNSNNGADAHLMGLSIFSPAD